MLSGTWFRREPATGCCQASGSPRGRRPAVAGCVFRREGERAWGCSAGRCGCSGGCRTGSDGAVDLMRPGSRRTPNWSWPGPGQERQPAAVASTPGAAATSRSSPPWTGSRWGWAMSGLTAGTNRPRRPRQGLTRPPWPGQGSNSNIATGARHEWTAATEVRLGSTAVAGAGFELEHRGRGRARLEHRDWGSARVDRRDRSRARCRARRAQRRGRGTKAAGAGRGSPGCFRGAVGDGGWVRGGGGPPRPCPGRWPRRRGSGRSWGCGGPARRGRPCA